MFKKKAIPEKDIMILWNGPSFKDSLKKHWKDWLFKWKDLMAVNSFLTTEYFETLKPKYYIVADSAFFVDLKKKKWSWEIFEINKNRVKDVQINFENWLLNKVTWDMTLFIPLHFNINKFLGIIKKNPHIKVERYIMNPLNIKFSWLRNFLFKYNFGMPKQINVLTAAICVALNMRYKNVYFVWWDFSFFEDLLILLS